MATPHRRLVVSLVVVMVSSQLLYRVLAFSVRGAGVADSALAFTAPSRQYHLCLFMPAGPAATLCQTKRSLAFPKSLSPGLLLIDDGQINIEILDG